MTFELKKGQGILTMGHLILLTKKKREKNQKKDHLQPLQTILHRIGSFVSILARSSARTHTPLQKYTRFEQNVHDLNTPVLGEFLKNLFLLKKRVSL